MDTKGREMEPEEMVIEYSGGQVDYFDDILIEAADKCGFKVWATGYNFKSKARELKFEKEQ